MKPNKYSVHHWPKQFQKIPFAYWQRGYSSGLLKGKESLKPEVQHLYWSLAAMTLLWALTILAVGFRK